MAYVSKQDADWLKEHGMQSENGWMCKKTGKPIYYSISKRSIHTHGLNGGPGEVRDVMHLWCTGCNPNFQPPAHGTPIQENDLVTMSR